MSVLPNSQTLAQLRHFLYMGDESKPYPASVTFPFNPEITSCLESLKALDTIEDTVDTIIEVYNNNHYLHIDTILYALAVLHSKSKLWSLAVKKICVSAENMLTFTCIHKEISKPTKGWGRCMRNFLKHWYVGKQAKDLAVEVTQVKSRCKWTHKDVLCMAHVKAKSKGNAAVLKSIMRGLEAAEREFSDDPEAEPVLKYLRGAYELSHTTDPVTAAGLLEAYNLSYQHVSHKILKSKEVSECLIPRLPIQQLLSQLPFFNRVSLLRHNSSHYKAVLERLNLAAEQVDADLDPVATFLAIRKWQISNKIVPGQNKAQPATPQLNTALENLHMASFKMVKSTEKHYLVALDIQPSMNLSKCYGCNAFTPSHVSDIVLMSLLKAEVQNVSALVYSTEELMAAEINPNMTLNEIVEVFEQIPAGPVTLSAPINWALTQKIPIDTFVVFTDRMSSADGSDLHTVFKEYKDTMHLPNSRYIISSLCDRESSFVPSDSTFLNIIGFNPKLLQIIQDFSRGIF